MSDDFSAPLSRRSARTLYNAAEAWYPERPKVSIKYAKQAVERDPLHARAWALIGRCTVRDDYDEGMRLLRLAMEIDPDDREIWMWAEFARDVKVR